MKSLIYTLLVGLPLSSMGQVTAPEAQQLVEFKSDSIVDFEFDGNYSYVLQKGNQKVFLVIYDDDRVIHSESLENSRRYELSRRCDGEVVLFEDESTAAVRFTPESKLERSVYEAEAFDCLTTQKFASNPTLGDATDDEKVISFFMGEQRETITIAYRDELIPVKKNPGQTANISGSERRNVHDRSIPERISYPTPKGEYSEPETRVYYEGSMENTRKSQYTNGAMAMESTTMDPLVYAVKDILVVINSSRDRINTYSLTGELLGSNEISIPRPAVWVRNQEDYVFNPEAQELFLLSRNSSGTQFYSMNVATGEATAIFSEKQSSELMMIKPSAEGVAYLVKRKGKMELKFAQI